jgi:hypothetical protein
MWILSSLLLLKLSFLAKIVRVRPKLGLKLCVHFLFNRNFKISLVSITLLIAPSIIWKTNFPWHLRSNATNASFVFSIAESSTKNVILPVRLKETQSFLCSEFYYLFLNYGNSFHLVHKFAVLSQLRPSQ